MFTHDIARAHIADLYADARRQARARAAQQHGGNAPRRFTILFAHK